MDIILFLIGGFMGGFIFAWIDDVLHKTCGVIDVDHNTEQCKVRITSNEISNRKNKKVSFKVNHDAKISREEQML